MDLVWVGWHPLAVSKRAAVKLTLRCDAAGHQLSASVNCEAPQAGPGYSGIDAAQQLRRHIRLSASTEGNGATITLTLYNAIVAMLRAQWTDSQDHGNPLQR